MKCAYLCYREGPHPAHLYQVKALDADIVPLRSNMFPSSLKRYDLVISEGLRPCMIGSLMRRFYLAKKHINILLRDLYLAKISLGELPLSPIWIKSLSCDGFIANSTLTARFFQELYGIENERIRVSWPLANLRSFIMNLNLDVSKKLNSATLCFLGHLTKNEGADLLPSIFLELWSRLKKRPTTYIVGRGPLLQDLLQASRTIENFHVLGYQSYAIIREIFSKSLLFIYPARAKAFGLPVVEAMSAGLVPVVTDMTGARDFVERVRPELVQPLDISRIAKKVTELLWNKGEIVKLSKKARRVALSWNENKAKETFLKCVNELITT